MGYVVAFNRDRDSYQVPLALAEVGQLEGLITDFFLPAWMACAPKIGHRTCRGLTWKGVRWDAAALKLQLWDLARAKSDLERQSVFAQLDQGLSRRAGALASCRRADLLLYSGYALEAFRRQRCRKVLFVYHPHGHGTDDVLRADFGRFPEVKASHGWHMAESQTLDSTRLEAELGLATDILCASTFTLRSLPSQHWQRPCAVVPYGCGVPAGPAAARAPGATRFLFVGQGVQRKGIHHLLRIWPEHQAKAGGSLELVSGRCDPWIAREVERLGLPRHRGLSPAGLNEAYDRADVLVLPSLVEGFGLVLLEALARGCHVISTTNTGLPDLVLPTWAAQVVAPGDLSGLQTALARADAAIQSGSCLRDAVRELARRHSWGHFRQGIRKALGLGGAEAGGLSQ